MQNILKKYQAVFCVCRLIYKGVLTCNYSLLLQNKSLLLTHILINHAHVLIVIFQYEVIICRAPISCIS
jgi:hypothetical protein